MTPLLRPVWCAATDCSRSTTTTSRPGVRRRSSRATASPMIPAPTTTASQRWGSSAMPAAGRTLVRPAEECERRAQQDPEVDPRRAVLDVPDIQLDPLGPRQGRAPVDLRPSRDPGLHLEPPPLPSRVLLDLIAERRSRPDHAHVAAQDVPELRQLVERELAQDAADARDPRVARVDREARTLLLGVDDHRAELQ